MTDKSRILWEQKKERLLERMRKLAERDVCLAFSGGADSSLLLYLAREAADQRGSRVYALTFDTSLHPRGDMEAAKETAREAGVPQERIPVDELKELPEIRNNPPDRCYLCKKLLYEKALGRAGELGAKWVLDGTNADDLQIYRPGLAALQELGIQSPLAECGFSKEEVRRFAGELGIRTAERPASPCMATRLPYGARLEEEVLRKLEQAEELLKKWGCRQVRARLHGEILRLELEPEAMKKAAGKPREILEILRPLGFRYFTLDLEGFRSGSMDLELTRPSASGISFPESPEDRKEPRQ